MIAVNDLASGTARETLAISWGMVFGVEDVNGFNSLQSRRYTDFLFGPEISDVSYGLLKDARLLRPESPILNALNVRFVLTAPNAPEPVGPTFRRVYDNPRVRVFENLAAYPRARTSRTPCASRTTPARCSGPSPPTGSTAGAWRCSKPPSRSRSRQPAARPRSSSRSAAPTAWP